MWDFINKLDLPQLVLLLLFVVGLSLVVCALLAPIKTKWISVPPLTLVPRVAAFVLGIIGVGYPVAMIAFPYQLVSDGKRQNGEACSEDAQCHSNACYPAPHPQPGGSGVKYCIADSMNCALPKVDGARYDTKVLKDGSELVCRDPGGGRRAQFMRAK
jgi:hypothetical protein